jgi:cellobiose phosphorylase
MAARAALATRQWAIYERSMRWIAKVGRPTWTLFEHFDFIAADKTNRRWYRGGIIPWLSYAEPSFLVIHELLGFRASLSDVRISPSMPPRMKRLRAEVAYRGHRIHVEVINNGGKCAAVSLDGKRYPRFDDGGTTFAPFTDETSIRITLGARGKRA